MNKVELKHSRQDHREAAYSSNKKVQGLMAQLVTWQ